MKTRLTLFLGITLGLIAAWYLFLFAPAMNNQSALLAQVAQTESELARLNQTMLEIPTYLEKRNNLLNSRIVLNSKLFGKAEILSMLGDIRACARDAGIKIVDITPPVSELLAIQQDVSSDSLIPLFINLGLQLNGDFFRLGRFVEQIEQSPFFRTANSCGIVQSPQSEHDLNMAISMRVILAGKEAARDR
ncbi:MAG: hypothetical protein SGI97_00505 [candidate division Zixibacteria bacterium]|nr:hypothetical protein [candidate division Zixibacteria bacterium]